MINGFSDIQNRNNNMATNSNSILFRLPSKLRLQIYELVLGEVTLHMYDQDASLFGQKRDRVLDKLVSCVAVVADTACYPGTNESYRLSPLGTPGTVTMGQITYKMEAICARSGMSPSTRGDLVTIFQGQHFHASVSEVGKVPFAKVVIGADCCYPEGHLHRDIWKIAMGT